MSIRELINKTLLFPKLNRQETVIGLYEAITKLRLAVERNDSSEIAKRLSNILIGVSAASNTFKVKDLVKALGQRLIELKKELKKVSKQMSPNS